MSYDLRIGVKVEGLDVIAVIDEPAFSSPTYNLAKMFRACTGWDYEQGKWYKAAEVYPLICHGIYELIANPGTYKPMNPSNGWGDISSALETLKSLKECIDNNTGASDWGKWQQIPLEHLWVRW